MGLSVGRILSEIKYWSIGLKKKKTEALYAELNKREEAAISNYSVRGNFLQCIFSVLVRRIIRRSDPVI